MAGKEESDFTLTNDFFKMGDGWTFEDRILAVEHVFLFPKTLGVSFGGDELGRLKGEPVHPWKSRSWARQWRIWSFVSIDHIVQKFSLVDANIDEGRRTVEFLRKRLQEVDLKL